MDFKAGNNKMIATKHFNPMQSFVKLYSKNNFIEISQLCKFSSIESLEFACVFQKHICTNNDNRQY